MRRRVSTLLRCNGSSAQRSSRYAASSISVGAPRNIVEEHNGHIPLSRGGTRPGLQLHLPPLVSWGSDPESFAKPLLSYLELLLHGPKRSCTPGFIMLRMFPDATLVRASPGSVPPLAAFAYSDADPKEYMKMFAPCLKCLASMLRRTAAERTPVILCLPTRFLVTQDFLHELFNLHSSLQWAGVVIELPSNHVLDNANALQLETEGSCATENSWCNWSVLGMPWNTVRQRRDLACFSHNGLSMLHTRLPFHLLLSWACDNGLLSSCQTWLGVDTIPTACLPDLKSHQRPRTSSSSPSHPGILATSSQQKPGECAAPTTSSVCRDNKRENNETTTVAASVGSLSPLLDLPSEDARQMILESIRKYGQEKELTQRDICPPLLGIPEMKDMKRDIAGTHGEEAQCAHQPPPVRPRSSSGDANNSEAVGFDDLYWKRMVHLVTHINATGFVFMPTFHTQQVQQWVAEARKYVNRDMTFIQSVPPGLSATELENQRLLREGCPSSEEKPIHRWLPDHMQAALEEALHCIPPKLQAEEHNAFFDVLRHLRSTNGVLGRGKVDILMDDDGTVRLKIRSDGPLPHRWWLQPPEAVAAAESGRCGALGPKGREASAVQEKFRQEVTLKQVEAVASMLLGPSADTAQTPGTLDKEPKNTIDGAVLAICPPGLREDVLRRSWSCLARQ